ncbi:MAG TPA: prepilin-type N-terminal cleavage/methylation domain-containing protein [Phycisphaerae bacterium]|nr:prepilin-type N-terminal cleavage/methylation domain-containing protein [Phycisphaerae bacterium]
MRLWRGFTLIEILVVLLIIVILVGIGLAIGAQVQANAQTSLLKEELLNLQGALTAFQTTSGNQLPQQNASVNTGNTPAMLVFLENYQRMNAIYNSTNNTWTEKPNILTQLPADLLVNGQFLSPDGVHYMTGVVEILDPWNNPIQYMPASGTFSYYPCFGQSPVIGSTTPQNYDATFKIFQTVTPSFTQVSFPSYVSYNNTKNLPPTPPIPEPPSPYTPGSPTLTQSVSGVTCWQYSMTAGTTPPHAPYFYSFGSLGPQANNITYGNYIYSYGP